jgi:hypothetical protein
VAEQRKEFARRVQELQPKVSNRSIAKGSLLTDELSTGAKSPTLRPTMPAKAVVKWGVMPHVVRPMDGAARRSSPTKRSRMRRSANCGDQRERELATRITALPDKRYGIADPPWSFEFWSEKGKTVSSPYKSHFIWAKDRAGNGYWNRNKHELLLVGTRGDVPAPSQGGNWRA